MAALAADTRSRRRDRDGPRARWLAIGAVLLAALLWSTSFALTKLTLAEVPPLTIGAMRFGVAAVILGALVRVGRERTPLTRRQRWQIGAAGLLGITAYFTIENIGVDLASASDATLIVASYPIITLAIEVLSGRARFSPVRVVGMMLAVAGVWLVVDVGPGGPGAGEHRLAGDALLVLGGVVWALYNIVARREGSGAPAVVVTYYQTLAGAGGFVLLSLLELGTWSMPSGGSLLRIAFLATGCSVAAFLAYNVGLRTLTPSAAVNLLNVVPVLGLVWAVVIADERLAAMQVVGGAVVICGVSLGMARTRRRSDATPSTAANSPDAIERKP